MDDNSPHLNHVAKLVHLVNALATQEPAGLSEMKETLITSYICFKQNNQFYLNYARRDSWAN